MSCLQGLCLLLLLAAVAPAPDGASYGAPPPPVAGGSSGGFGGGPVRRLAGGFGGGLGGGSVRGPVGGFAGGLGGAASGRRGALVEPVGPGLRPDGLPIGPGTPYSFSWAVDEPEYGNQYGHQEESDGVVTQGEYRVLLPDGRTQIVTYLVEGDSGFQAQVTYEGEAQFPETGLPGLPAVPGVPGVPTRGVAAGSLRPSLGNGRVTRLGAGLTFPPRQTGLRGSPFPDGTDLRTESEPEDAPGRPSTSYGY